MVFSKRAWVVAVAMGSVLTGCTSDTKSEFVKTKAMWAEMKVVANGESAKVGVELNVGGSSGTNVVLSGEDYLEVTAGGQSKRLGKDYDFLDVDYETRIDISEGNTLFEISLHRKKDEVQRSTVELPLGFTILSPQKGDELTSNAILNVQIDGSDSASDAEIEFTGRCKNSSGSTIINQETESFNNTSSRTFRIGEMSIFNKSQIDKERKCELDIKITRSRKGQVASAFKGSSKIKAYHYREVKDIEVDLSR